MSAHGAFATAPNALDFVGPASIGRLMLTDDPARFDRLITVLEEVLDLCVSSDRDQTRGRIDQLCQEASSLSSALRCGSGPKR